MDSDETHGESSSRGRWGFVFILAATATLLIRPGEIAPSLVKWPIYEALMLASLISSLPAILGQFRLGALRRRPTTVFVLGMVAAISLSHLAHGDLWNARYSAATFMKVVVYYLLLVGLIRTPERLQRFLHFVVACLLVVTIVCLLQFHEVIDIPTITACQQSYGVDDDTGGAGTVLRLQATGIFSDPNDFSLILVAALLISWHGVRQSRGLLWPVVWLVPTIIFGYAIALTQSRGGFLALLAGIFYLAVHRFGWRKSLPVIALALAALLIVVGGRQTNIDLSNPEDTAQGRLQLWRDALNEFKTAPLFGIGKENLVDAIGLVAHNAYLHCFAELGVFGGTVFVGLIYVTVAMLRRVAADPDEDAEAEDSLQQWRPTVLAVIISYGAGVFSLSRPYGIATYLILAIGAAYYGIAAAQSDADETLLDLGMMRRVCLASVLTLLGLFVFVRVFALSSS